MPRFVRSGKTPDDPSWIAYHERNLELPDSNPRNSAEAHRYVQGTANRVELTYVEVADDLGEPCTLFPNLITPEGQPSKPEARG